MNVNSNIQKEIHNMKYDAMNKKDKIKGKKKGEKPHQIIKCKLLQF